MWQAMLRFSPKLSTFSWVLALMLTTDGCASSIEQRLSRIASFTGDSFGLCSQETAKSRHWHRQGALNKQSHRSLAFAPALGAATQGYDGLL